MKLMLILIGISLVVVVLLQFEHQAKVDAKVTYLENVMQNDLDQFRSAIRLRTDECAGLIYHVQELELRHKLAMTHTSWETRLAFREDYYKIKYAPIKEQP